MNISFHLNFNGNCQEAFEYYAENLGGKIGLLLPFKDSPAASSVTAQWQNKIVHANIQIAGIELAGADVLPEQYQKPNGFYILLGLNSAEEVNTIYSDLSGGGKTLLAPQKTFWSQCYAICVDRFGVPWKINCGI